MLLFISILSLVLFYVTGAPQLKLGQSGYEIISINDHNLDDSLPLASKVTMESSSRYNKIGALNLEKATDSFDEDDGLVLPPQQYKRHYDIQQSSSDPKVISESQPNTIDVTSKQSSSQKSNNIYLTVGIPKSFNNPITSVKEPPNLIPISEKTNRILESKVDFFDDSGSREELGNEEKMSVKSINAKINDKKLKSAAKLSKQSIKNTSEKMSNQGSDSSSSAMFESHFEMVDLKDEDRINALVADAHRALGLISNKSDFQDKQDRFETPSVKTGFTMVTHFPSIRIHHRNSFFVPHKGPVMFSPIYPSGFDILTGKAHKKVAVPTKELHGKHHRIDHKNTKNKKSFEIRLENHKNEFLLGHEFNEIRPGSKEFGKSYQEQSSHKIPSVLVLNNMNHDLLNPRTGNIITFPISATPLKIQPPPFSNQQPLQPMKHKITHFEMNSIPLITNHFDNSLPATDSSILHPQGLWEKIMPRSQVDLTKRHQQSKDLDREYLDSEVNNMITNSELKSDFLKNSMRRMSILNPEPIVKHFESGYDFLPPNIESSKGLMIGIVHEFSPDDSQGTVIDAKKDDFDREGHEMHNSSQTQSSATSKSSCKQMKTGIPAFYEFLAKFSNTLLGKALQYESDIQAQDNASKLMEITKIKNLEDNEIFGFIP